MKRVFLLSLALAILGWAAWYDGPDYERSRAPQKPQATAAAGSPGGADGFIIAEEDSVGSGREFPGLGMCLSAFLITTAAAIVRVKDKTGGT